MRSKEIVGDIFDDDTYKVLDISLKFLELYFGYTAESAVSVMSKFFSSFSERFDENAIHHESSYRLAAIIHYLAGIGGNSDSLGDWMIANKFNQPPPEAFEYFRENYFDKYTEKGGFGLGA